ncbi:nuclear transport factor 2 family protein [Duganella callida]|uniref:Nuclear transport factor 2 family protein n=1 Tax=Duganella callida TaxID=2561932 RepID=A0A4Y9SB26_9BURK|nr:nuclear transport factor 2 family protein [Duganella callida]TFW19370.1 nuclear transport factor 2 family protein [Duganella callida]
MKKILLPLLATLPLLASASACLPVEALIQRDNQYEEALRVGDLAFLRGLLADDFIWVHTLGSQYDTRPVLLARLEKPVIYKARTTSDVHAHALGDTVVLRGLSTVDQWNADGKTWRSNRYQFMRTYVNVGGECKLLSVQTMKVWSSSEAK